MEKKILSQTQKFDVIDIGGRVGIKPTLLEIVVMPLTKDEAGMPKEMGVINEYNPLRNGDRSVTLISVDVEEEDPDLISAAKAALKKAAGFDVQELARWQYLGPMTTSKLVDQEIHCFSVDVTGIDGALPEPEGLDEENSKFEMQSVDAALLNNDCFILAVFIKYFQLFMKSKNK